MVLVPSVHFRYRPSLRKKEEGRARNGNRTWFGCMTSGDRRRDGRADVAEHYGSLLCRPSSLCLLMESFRAARGAFHLPKVISRAVSVITGSRIGRYGGLESIHRLCAVVVGDLFGSHSVGRCAGSDWRVLVLFVEKNLPKVSVFFLPHNRLHRLVAKAAAANPCKQSIRAGGHGRARRR